MTNQKKRLKYKLDGWIALDKPLEMTSTQAVSALKRLLSPEKIGHAGTLDPLASGILPLALGEATKTVPYVMNATKEYRFTLCFGAETSTDDREGEIVRMSEHLPDDAAIHAALPKFRGGIVQVPPAFSAIKVDGKRAYDMARAGEEVSLKERPAYIESFELVSRPDARLAEFHVVCGKGTYIRSLARDLARSLDSAGHVSTLRRTRVGPFDEASAISLDMIEDYAKNAPPFSDGGALPPFLKGPAWGLDDIPALAVDDAMTAKLRHGQAILASPAFFEEGSDGEIYKALNGRRLVALTMREGRCFTPVRVFYC